MKPRNTKRASSRRNKRSKTKRYFGGVSPNVAADNAKLAELIEYAENAGIRRQPNERLHEDEPHPEDDRHAEPQYKKNL